VEDKYRYTLSVSNRFFGQGIQHSLANMPDIAVAGTAEISDDVLTYMDNNPPDVTLIDIDGAAENGLSLARKIKQHSSSIAIVV